MSVLLAGNCSIYVPTEVTAFPGITVTDGCVPPNKGAGNWAQAKSALKPSISLALSTVCTLTAYKWQGFWELCLLSVSTRNVSCNHLQCWFLGCVSDCLTGLSRSLGSPHTALTSSVLLWASLHLQFCHQLPGSLLLIVAWKHLQMIYWGNFLNLPCLFSILREFNIAASYLVWLGLLFTLPGDFSYF